MCLLLVFVFLVACLGYLVEGCSVHLPVPLGASEVFAEFVRPLVQVGLVRDLLCVGDGVEALVVGLEGDHGLLDADVSEGVACGLVLVQDAVFGLGCPCLVVRHELVEPLYCF